MAVTAPVPPTPPSAPAPPQAVTAAPAVGSGADASGFGTTVTTQDADSAVKHPAPQRPAAPAGRPESRNGQDKDTDTSSGQQSSSAGGLTMTTADDENTSSASVQSSASGQPAGLPTDGHPLVYWPFAVLLLLAAIVLGIRAGRRRKPAQRPPAPRSPAKGTKTRKKSHFEIRI